MKELRDIVESHAKAVAENKKTALATVVQIEGSSYRQPGARMLITEDGMLTGAISGGCLEGDALRKALLVIANGTPMVVTYDTNDEDDAKFGIGLGCNGIIQILIEPVIETDLINPIRMIEKLLSGRRSAVLVTFFSLDHRRSSEGGTRYMLQKDNEELHQVNEEDDVKLIRQHGENVLATQQSIIYSRLIGQKFDLLFDFIPPALSVIIVGAGNDIMPLVAIAQTMGWETTVADGRTSYATTARFPKATRVLLAKPSKVLSEVVIDDRTVVLLMTHNYNYDLDLLKQLVETPTPYIGVLGPRKKTLKMIDELSDSGLILDQVQQNKIYGPAGFDTGAENAEEIALSICAEINAVINGRDGQMLRIKNGAIHNSSHSTT